MLFSKFFQSTWNTIASICLILSLIIAGFVIPPKFSTELIESTIDYGLFSKFILIVCVALFLMPTLIYKSRRYNFVWWSSSAILLCSALILFGLYYVIINSKTAIYSEQRVVIGDNYLPLVKIKIDSIERSEGVILTPEEVLQKTAGGVKHVWSLRERQSNSLTIIFIYMVTLILFAFSAIAAIQALYCTANEKEKRHVENQNLEQ